MTRPPVEISAEKMQDLLRKKGIIVRYFNRPDKGIDGFLRISIGTDAEMERLFDGIRAILAEIWAEMSENDRIMTENDLKTAKNGRKRA
jgi:hypothetical protein